VADRGGQSPAKEPARPGAIERILFSRVELWVIAVLLLLGCLLAIGFGAVVLDAERGDFRFGPVSRAALAVAEIPRTAKQLLTRDADLLVSNSYRDRGKPTGWSFPSDRMTGPDGAQADLGAAAPKLGREFRSGAVFASLALVVSFGALGLNSISISRIEGADGAGLIALSTQFIFLATFVAGAGLRTSVSYRVGAGLWSPRSAVRRFMSRSSMTAAASRRTSCRESSIRSLRPSRSVRASDSASTLPSAW